MRKQIRSAVPTRTQLGLEIEAGLKEVEAHRQGKIRLQGRVIEEMSGDPEKRGLYKPRAKGA